MRSATVRAANYLLHGVRREDASSAPRHALDFGPPPASSQAAARQGLRNRLRRIVTRKSSGPMPGAQMNPPLQDRSRLVGATQLSAADRQMRFVRAALERVIPGLDEAHDPQLERDANKLADALVVLEQRCADAKEYGLSIERVLSAMLAQPRIHARGSSNAELTIALKHAGEFVRDLNDCLRNDKVANKPTRAGVARAALLLAMPGLSAREQGTLPVRKFVVRDSRIEEIAGQLVSQLELLDKTFEGRQGYALDRLVAALCNHGRIVEFGRSQDTVEHALAGLSAMVATVEESVGPGRDGFALNALVGLDSGLDQAIVSLRADRVKAFMLEQFDPVRDEEKRINPETGKLFTKEEGAKHDATELVAKECDVAKARVRLMRAFDRAGVPRPVEVIRGLKMDAVLVKGLVDELDSHGNRAKDVGLAIMGVFLREQDVAVSTSGGRMAGCWLAALGVQRQRIIAGEMRDPRLDSLKDPGVINAELYERLGLSGIEHKHVLQLEKQGLSSAAEAHTALRVIKTAMQTWLADEGPTRMKKKGLLDVLKTQRQEDRAVTLGESLLEMLRQDQRARADETLLPPDDGEARNAAIRDVVRAAILHLLPLEKAAKNLKATPPLHTFRATPSAVKGILVKWGVDEDLGHVIETELDGNITPAKLAQWVADAGLLDEAAPAMHAAFPPHYQQAQDRKAVVEALADLKIGTRVNMTSAKRVRLTTGLMGDAVGVTVKPAAGKSSSIDVGNSGDPGDPYEINFRAGGDFRVGVEATAPLLRMFDHVGVKLGPVAATELSGQRMSGVMLRCASPAKQQSLMDKLMGKTEIGFEDLAAADGIMFTRELQVGVDVSAGVQALLEPGKSEFSWGSVRKLRFMFGARMTGNVAAQGLTYLAENNKGSVTKTEKVTAARVAATASAGLFFTATENNGASVPIAELGKKWELLIRERLRVYVREGRAVDVESFDQASLSGSSALAFARRLGGPAYEQTMDYLKQSFPEVHTAIETLMADIRKNDMASLAWKLDADAGFYPANAALEQADAARDHRSHNGGIAQDKSAADARKKEARRILADRERHHLTRVADVSTVETLEANTFLVGLFEKAKSATASSLPVEVKLGGGGQYEAAYADELVKLVVLASRELRWGVPTHVKT